MSMRIITLLVVFGLFPQWTMAQTLELQEKAPERYTVRKGDTLWDISGRYLKQPWRWPELWGYNKTEIKNPHRIYPNDVIVIDRSGAQPRLRVLGAADEASRPGGTVKLSPRVRSELLERDAIPAISPSAIAPFLSQPLVTEAGEFERSPYIVGTDEERMIIGTGDRAYVSGLGASPRADWHIYRPGKALVDPDTGEALGTEAEFLGNARVVRAAEPATVEITRATKEINTRDRLGPAPEDNTYSYIPHAPTQPIEGRIISAYGGVAEIGQYAIAVINRGRVDGIEEGHVLAVYRKGRTVAPLKTARKNWFPFVAKECVKADTSLRYDGYYDPIQTHEKCSDAKSTAATAPVASWTYSDVGCLKPGKRVRYDEFFDPKDAYRTPCRATDTGPVTLPDERSGLLMVFRVFDRVSYALVAQSVRPVYLLDAVRNP